MRTTFQQLKSLIQNHYGDFRDGTEVAQTSEGSLGVEFDGIGSLSVQFNVRNDLDTAQGIHIHSIKNAEELEHHLIDAIETALKDGFRTIWIHKGAI